MTSILFHNDTRALNHLWYESHKNLITSLCIELGKTDEISNLVEKFLGDRLRIKKLKDPTKPTRIRTSYLFFCSKHRPKIIEKYKKKGDKIRVGDIQKILGKRWKNLTDKDKVPFIKQQNEDRDRYEKEMEDWHASKQ